MAQHPTVRQLRVTVEVDDFDAARGFFGGALGLAERAASQGSNGARVSIFEAGIATLEILDAHDERFGEDVDVGGDVAPRFRLAFQVDDARTATRRLAIAGASVIAEPAQTPWRSISARLTVPGDVQLTVFEELTVADPASIDLDTLTTRVIDLAIDSARSGMLPFAAVVVDDQGSIVATGFNTTLRTMDPTAHAEVEAVRSACRRLGTSDLTGMTLVSSCQPCALCQAACVDAGIAQITYAAGATDVPNLGGIHRPQRAVLQHAAQSAMPDYLVQRQHARSTEPFTAYLTRPA
jgi:tRNA(Arg) A34 adenosine deaminase TadA/predicted enzyme related to lactoylglutathione lyase